jgi:hypothetical protein
MQHLTVTVVQISGSFSGGPTVTVVVLLSRGKHSWEKLLIKDVLQGNNYLVARLSQFFLKKKKKKLILGTVDLKVYETSGMNVWVEPNVARPFLLTVDDMYFYCRFQLYYI